MNLFKFVEVFGTSKGFVGKSFFSSELENLTCCVCGKVLVNNNRVTCSVNCSEEYKEIIRRDGNRRRFYHDKGLKKLSREEFILFIKEKYGGK